MKARVSGLLFFFSFNSMIIRLKAYGKVYVQNIHQISQEDKVDYLPNLAEDPCTIFTVERSSGMPFYQIE